jgi:hypothetical protein
MFVNQIRTPIPQQENAMKSKMLLITILLCAASCLATELKFITCGGVYGTCEFDELRVAATFPSTDSIFCVLQAENPKEFTTGRPIWRSFAIQQRVHGQFGCEATAPYRAQGGFVTYDIWGADTCWLQLRYSRYIPNRVDSIQILLGAEHQAWFLPSNTGSWNVFQDSEWIPITFSHATPVEGLVIQPEPPQLQLSWRPMNGSNGHVEYTIYGLSLASQFPTFSDAVATTADTSISCVIGENRRYFTVIAKKR